MSAGLRGLYAVTSASICRSTDSLTRAVEQALAGGARLIQYRNKESGDADRIDQARALLGLCKNHRALLIINDDPTLAATVGAHGVHLGRSDPAIAMARAVCGPRAIIGVSCGSSLDHAAGAVDQGADYVAFGRFFPSRTKPDAPAAELSLLRAARARMPGTPICAIGGISASVARSVVDSGADLLAAVDGVFGADDIRSAAAALAGAFA